MTVPAKRRFDPAAFFNPASVHLTGAETVLGRRVLANIRAAGFTGVLATDDEAMAQADLALVADDATDVEAALCGHAARGARGAMVLSNTQGLSAMAKAAGIRVLGPYSYGIVRPALGLNASPFSLIPRRGKVALIGQSASLARSVIDWAVPNNIGFSHIIGIGGNADIGFGLVLDFLSRDADTAAILLDIGRLRDPRLFLAAARAAARLRPVVAITPGLRLRDTQPNSRAAVDAAFARAGVLRTCSFSEFLAAAETLTRVKPVRGESLAIVSNSVGAGGWPRMARWMRDSRSARSRRRPRRFWHSAWGGCPNRGRFMQAARRQGWRSWRPCSPPRRRSAAFSLFIRLATVMMTLRSKRWSPAPKP